MEVKRIPTENAKAEQWRLLSQYFYPANIRRFLEERGLASVDGRTIDFIAGCVQQSSAYFTATENTPLDISPLLLYYGATNLLSGIGAMLAGTRLSVREHGMRLGQPTTPIADISVTPISPSGGALQQFSNVFSDGCQLINGAAWTLGEILASIPDLKVEYEMQYRGQSAYTVPVEVVRTRKGDRERILVGDIARFQDQDRLFGSVLNFEKAYLEPQRSHQNRYVILRYRMNGVELGTYSTTGQKHLQIAHRKHSQLLNPSQVILIFMGLFALGYLSRYHPEVWHPFVRRDDTGERVVIEKFLSTASRYLPNLVLESIYGYRIQFINEIQGVTDLTSSVTESEIQGIVKQMLNRGDLT